MTKVYSGLTQQEGHLCGSPLCVIGSGLTANRNSEASISRFSNLPSSTLPSARHAVSLRGFDVPACQKSRKTPSVRRFVGTGKNCWHKIGLYRPVRQPLRNCREKGDRSTRSQEAQERNPVALPAEERAAIDSKAN